MGMEESDVVATPTEVKVCPECRSTKLIKDYELGEIVCGNCGLTIT